MRAIWLLLVCSLCSLPAYTQDTTDYITVRSNAFIEGLLSRKGHIYPINHQYQMPFGTPTKIYPKTEN
ncbi:MAG: hypothetical protein ACKO6K_05085, partial [Chitinophagaceae bacterium]